MRGTGGWVMSGGGIQLLEWTRENNGGSTLRNSVGAYICIHIPTTGTKVNDGARRDTASNLFTLAPAQPSPRGLREKTNEGRDQCPVPHTYNDTEINSRAPTTTNQSSGDGLARAKRRGTVHTYCGATVRDDWTVRHDWIHTHGTTHLDAGGHGERVARQGARLVHGPRGRHHLHDVLAPAVRAHGKTASDHLSYHIICITSCHVMSHNRIDHRTQEERRAVFKSAHPNVRVACVHNHLQVASRVGSNPAGRRIEAIQ